MGWNRRCGVKRGFNRALKSRLVAGVLSVRRASLFSAKHRFNSAFSLLSVRKRPSLIAHNRDLGVGHSVGRGERALWAS